MSLIKGMNPVARIGTQAEAVTATRASAIAIFLGVAIGALGIVLMMNGGMATIEAAVVSQSGGDADLEEMAEIMAQGALYAAIGIVVIQFILGLFQWFKPNIVIPIIFLILVIWGVGTSVLGMMVPKPDVPQTAMNAPAMMWLSLAVLVVQAILHIAGIRGASALSKFREAQSH